MKRKTRYNGCIADISGTRKKKRKESLTTKREKKRLRDIAERTGYSQATVSRALNNCAPVDREGKAAILDAARALRYPLRQKNPPSPALAPLGALLPAKPRYFWDEAYRGVREGARQAGSPLAAALYCDLDAEADFLYGLKCLEEREPLAYIVVPVNTTAARDALAALLKRRPVVLLTERIDASGAAFVGADAFGDGMRLAEACAQAFGTRRRILTLTDPGRPTADARAEGFLCGAERYGAAETARLALPRALPSAAELARKMDAAYRKSPYDFVFAAQGILPSVCLALGKLRLAEKIVCAGFENPPSNGAAFRKGTLTAAVRQDVFAQGFQSALLAAGLAAGGTQLSPCYIPSKIIEKEQTGMQKIRVGVFGAGRGRTMIETVALHEDAELVAICDKYEPLLKSCGELAGTHGLNVALYTDFDEFFRHDMDAVILANYAHEHAPYAIRLLRSGRHVASEVLPVKNLAEAVELCEAVEQSGRVYAYLENYCYFPATAEMRRLYRAGVLGGLSHAEGEYVHNCESIWPQFTWGEREHWRNTCASTFYCTHSLGPIIHMTGLRPVQVSGVENMPAQRLRALGSLRAEAAMELVRLENGATVKSLHGDLVREPPSIWYCIYGQKGMAESDRWGDGVAAVNLFTAENNNVQRYAPAPAVDSALAGQIIGHGGSDFYTVHYFLQKILGRPEGEESIGVYEALDMALPGLLAYRSIQNGGVPVDVPDFRHAQEREPYRGDTWSTWGEGENRAPNAVRQPLSDEEFEAVRRKARGQ